MLYTSFIVLIVIISVLLVLIVLMQDSKGGGLSGQFGGEGTRQMFGAKKATDLLERLTWGLAIALFALSLATNFMIDRSGGQMPGNINIEKAKEKSSTGGSTLPIAPQNNNNQSTDKKPDASE